MDHLSHRHFCGPECRNADKRMVGQFWILMMQIIRYSNTRSLGPTRKLCPFTRKAARDWGPENACSLRDLGMTSVVEVNQFSNCTTTDKRERIQQNGNKRK